MWNLVEPQVFRVEACGTSTFNSGTFMWNLVEPQLFNSGTVMCNLVEPPLLRVEPCGILSFKWKFVEPGAKFRSAASNHPEALLEEP